MRNNYLVQKKNILNFLRNMTKTKKHKTTVVIDLGHRNKFVWKHNMKAPQCDDKVLTEGAGETLLKFKNLLDTSENGNVEDK